MADTTTTNYSLTKPEIDASENTWGTKLNANMDALDAQMFANATSAATALATALAANLSATAADENADTRLLKANNLSDLSDAAEARDNLSLTKVTSDTDTTAGSVVTVGWMGLGEVASVPHLDDVDAIDTATGFYRVTGDTTGDLPAGVTFGAVQILRSGTGVGTIIQIFYQQNLDSIAARRNTTGTWDDWQYFLTDTSKASDSESKTGTDNDTYMTPLRTAAAISARSGILAVIEDQKTSGTNAQTITAGGWETRNLNTIERNVESAVSLSSNAFTVAVDGWVEWACPGADTFSTRLYSVTDSAVVERGQSSSTSAGSIAIVTGGSAVEAGKTYRIEQKTSITRAAGAAASNGTEIYTRVKLFAI